MMTIQEIEAACANSQPIPPGDSVYARMEFPFTRRLYPLGFPVEFSSNCEAVLDAAAEGWGEFDQMFSITPIRIQVGVLEGQSSDCPPAPSYRVQQHMFSFVADQENFGTIDLCDSFVAIWLTKAAVANRSYLRHFFLECAMVCPIATRYATGVHSACVSRDGVGVLLCGDSGAGKSTLAYACAKAGWTYVTDDGSYLVHGSDELLAVGNCHQVRFRPPSSEFFPEIAGREITRRAQVGKPSIELSPTTMPGIRVAQAATIKHMVLLNRREGKNCGLQPYSKDVLRQFLRQGRFSPLTLMPPHYATIERLLELDAMELKYRDLDWAIARLEELVDRTAGA